MDAVVVLDNGSKRNRGIVWSSLLPEKEKATNTKAFLKYRKQSQTA